MIDYETWRPALVAFYRSECCFQSAENVERGYPLTISDKALIEALAAAHERAPLAA